MENIKMDELKLLLKEVLNGDISEMKQSLAAIVNYNVTQKVILDNIKEQTEKTNGRVTRLEDKVQELAIEDQKHFSVCPHTITMGKLQEQVNQVVSNRTFIARVIAVTISIVGAVGVIISILINFLIKK